MMRIYLQDIQILKSWRRIGSKIGIAFQIQDDILDVISSEEELLVSRLEVMKKIIDHVCDLDEGIQKAGMG